MRRRGTDIFFLVGIHAGRDEEPDLVEDEGAGEDDAADEGGLEQKVERFGGVLVVEVEVEVGERLLHEAVELVAEDPADDEAAEEIREGVDEALAQLFEMLHQAHAGEFGAVADGLAGPVEDVDISHAGSRSLARLREW
jgi:hypothetical protein